MNPSKYMTFKELADYYFTALEERRSKYNGNNWGPLKVIDVPYKKGVLAKHVFPAIGDIELKDFDVFTNRILISSLKRKGLSQSFIYLIIMNTKQILREAFNLGLVNKNTVDSFHATNDITPKFYNYSNKELNAICNASLLIYNAIMFPLALLTGMEKKEILALRWNDIDIKNKSLSINRYIGKENLGFSPLPATGNKHRTIYLGDKAWKLLDYQYFIENPGKKLNDANVLPDTYVFHKKGDTGKYLTHEPKEILKKLRKESGVQTIGFIYLRRYYSAAVTIATNDVVSVNRLMGYKDSNSTLSIMPYTNNIIRGEIL